MQLVGSLTALVTPFADSGAIDFDAFGRLIDYQLAGGTQGLIVAGSTGEAAALEGDEFERLIAYAKHRVGGRIPVLAGSGLSATAATIKQTQRAAAAGADAALVVTPPYVRPTQAGLLAHYRAVAEQGGLPVVLYNVPGRTGVDLQPETVALLCQHEAILGLKEARAGEDRLRALLPLRCERFRLLSGDDGSAAEAFRLGFDGVISVVSNIAPAMMRALWDARGAASAFDQESDRLWRALCEFLGVESNPIPAKAVLAELGLMGDGLRLPLLPLSSPHRPEAADLARQVTAVERQFNRFSV